MGVTLELGHEECTGWERVSQEEEQLMQKAETQKEQDGAIKLEFQLKRE